MAVRLATMRDLASTAVIAARSFNLSPWNAFYRPYAKDYPDDMQESYRQEQEDAIKNDRKLFTVIEAEVDSSKDSSQAIVGFAIWNYAEHQQGSSLASATRPAASTDQGAEDGTDRSADPYRGKLLFDATGAAVEKYFKGHMELDNMAVDPTQFLHGYGTQLCRHGMEIARKDAVPIGVIASGSGYPLYKYLGYTFIEKQTVKDERPGKEASTDFWVMKWESAAKL